MTIPNPFSFVAAVFRAVRYWLTGYVVIVPEEVEKWRADHCTCCLFFDEEVGQCEECGCPIEAKVMVASEYCPLGKWKAWKKSKRKS